MLSATSPIRTRVLLLLLLVTGYVVFTAKAYAQSGSPDASELTHEELPPRGQSYEAGPLKRGRNVFPAPQPGDVRGSSSASAARTRAGGTLGPRRAGALIVDKRFEGFDFDDNPEENGFFFIPPDPIGAAGKNRLVAVVNSMIEARNKGGALKWREGLLDFFASLTPGFLPFDPKIVYDEYEDRFVVVALDYTDVFFGDASNGSKLLLAVSKTGHPKTPTAADWHFHAIDAAFTDDNFFFPGSFDYWADYPGFEVDEEAVYITANAFTFVTELEPFGLVQLPGGTRLWIVDKGVDGGFYDGGPAEVDFFDPYDAVPMIRDAGLNLVTTMPAQVHGEGGVGPGIGTYLVSYSGLTFGPEGPEAVQVFRVDDPLGGAGGPFFAHEFVVVGDIEEPFSALPDAPQAGTDVRIEVNDRRALDAVWRDSELWFTTTIAPNAGPDAGQATAHWFRLNTAGGAVVLADQGSIGGEDIAPNTYTSFPAVAVNASGDAAFGFSASAPSIFPGAFATARQMGDPPGFVHEAVVVHEGEDYYFRAFGGSRNRWGDYSGIALDPTDENHFWVFNEYAGERGIVFSAFPEQDGRWETAWGRLKLLGGAAGKQLAVSEPVESAPMLNAAVPREFALDQNYPNPFNPSTRIEFALPEASAAQLVVYDVAGREVARLVDGALPAGRHSVDWQTKDLPSGVYVYKLSAGSFTQTRRMVLLR